MAELTEYYIRYACTSIKNSTLGSTSSSSRTVSKSSFKSPTGNINEPIGEVTRIVFSHYHSSTKACEWGIYSILNWNGGNCTSDSVSKSISGNVPKYTNTFTSGLPSADIAKNWTSITMQVYRKSGNSDATLYYRATSSQPMYLYIYFHSAKEMGADANTPVIEGLSFSDTSITSINSTTSGSCYDKYGSYIQKESYLQATGTFALDSRYPYLTATHTLTLSKNNSVIATYIETTAASVNTVTFDIGEINDSGNISYSYTVTDSATHEESGSAESPATTGTLPFLSYYEPRINAFHVDRFVEILGETTEYVARSDGTHIWLTIDSDVCPVTGQNTQNTNSWGMQLSYMPKNSRSNPTIDIVSNTDNDGINGKHYSLSEATSKLSPENTKIGTTEIATNNDYIFLLTLTDSFGNTAVSEVELTKATGYFNVEKYGVSVGMRSLGSENDKRFEVAEDYESIFYGGIRGVNVYSTSEIETGGKWLNGEKIYRTTILTGSISRNYTAQYSFGSWPEITEDDVVTKYKFGALVRAYGYAQRETGSQILLPNPTVSSGSVVTLWIGLSNGIPTINIGVGNDTGAAITEGVLTIEYTKEIETESVSQSP